mmetsp:Transcript_36845/g.89277  ORF Transcript_36845/g.89277 Transcript_36845/m.89277 type:complete len:103 (-) Transcript_36845:448-756(-)
MPLSLPPPVDDDNVDNWMSLFVSMKSKKYRRGRSTAFDGKTKGISCIMVVPAVLRLGRGRLSYPATNILVQIYFIWIVVYIMVSFPIVAPGIAFDLTCASSK